MEEMEVVTVDMVRRKWWLEPGWWSLLALLLSLFMGWFSGFFDDLADLAARAERAERHAVTAQEAVETHVRVSVREHAQFEAEIRQLQVTQSRVTTLMETIDKRLQRIETKLDARAR